MADFSEEQIQQNEEERILNEAQRVSDEVERQQGEENRIENERERISKEAERETNEIQRMAREDISGLSVPSPLNISLNFLSPVFSAVARIKSGIISCLAISD